MLARTPQRTKITSEKGAILQQIESAVNGDENSEESVINLISGYLRKNKITTQDLKDWKSPLVDDIFTFTLLDLTVMKSKLQLSQFLVKQVGLDVNTRTNKKTPTPLFFTTQKLNIDSTRFLISSAVNVNAELIPHKTTAFHTIISAYCEKDNAGNKKVAEEIIQELIYAGADIFHQDISGMTPMMVADTDLQKKIVEFIKEKKYLEVAESNKAVVTKFANRVGELRTENRGLEVEKIDLKRNLEESATDFFEKSLADATRIQQLMDEKKAIQKEVKFLNSQIKKSAEKNTALTAQHNAEKIKTELAAAEPTKKTRKLRAKEHRSKAQIKDEEITALKKQNKELEASLITLQKQIAKDTKVRDSRKSQKEIRKEGDVLLKQDISGLRGEILEKNAQMEQQRIQLNADYNQLVLQYDALDLRAKLNLALQKSKLDEELGLTKKELAKTQSELKQSRAQSSTRQEEVNLVVKPLQEEVISLKKEIDEQCTVIVRGSDMQKALQAANDELREGNKVFEEGATNSQVKKAVTEIRARYNELVGRNKDLQKSHESLTNSHESTKGNLVQARKENEGLKYLIGDIVAKSATSQDAGPSPSQEYQWKQQHLSQGQMYPLSNFSMHQQQQQMALWHAQQQQQQQQMMQQQWAQQQHQQWEQQQQMQQQEQHQQWEQQQQMQQQEQHQQWEQQHHLAPPPKPEPPQMQEQQKPREWITRSPPRGSNLTTDTPASIAGKTSAKKLDQAVKRSLSI